MLMRKVMSNESMMSKNYSITHAKNNHLQFKDFYYDLL